MPQDSDAFNTEWGLTPPTTPVTAAPTRVLDPKSFEAEWLASGQQLPAEQFDTNSRSAAANAMLGGALNGVPVVGPYLKDAGDRLGALGISALHGIPFHDALDLARGASAQSAKAFPASATAGEIGGAVASMALPASIAPRAMGLAGPLLQRATVGGTVNALINGADSAARGGDWSDVRRSAAIGGAVGGVAPLATNALGAVGRRMFATGDAGTNALLQRADQLGIPIRFSQATDTPFIAKMSQMAGMLPGSGMATLKAEQQTAVNRAIARTFGEDADAITPDVMARARTRLGGEFDDIGSRSTLHADSRLLSDFHGILSDSERALGDNEARIINRHIGGVIDKIEGPGVIPGDIYQGLVRKGAPLDRSMHSSDPNVRYYAGQVREALDDALQRSVSPELRNRLMTARSQYKAMKTIEDLSEKAPTGDISPTLLMGAVRKSYEGMAYGRGGGDLPDIARIGQRFMRQPSDSGTPLGEAALNVLRAYGPGMAGAGAMASYGYLNNWSPTEMGLSLAALPLTAASARGVTTLLNRPQVVGNALNRLPLAVPAARRLLDDPSPSTSVLATGR